MMDDIDKKQLYETAWKHWGGEMQLDILIEEMAEFIQAILKTRRNGVTYSYSFFEEMADVLICLEQVETRLRKFPRGNDKPGSTWDQVMEIKEMKLTRLQDRLMESLEKKHEGLGEFIMNGGWGR